MTKTRNMETLKFDAKIAYKELAEVTDEELEKAINFYHQSLDDRIAAMALTCSQEMEATLTRFGSAEPDLVLEASRSCTATGGVFTINSNDLSL